MLTLAGIVITTIGTVLGIKIKQKGRQTTSELNVLLLESRDMRKELRTELGVVKVELEEVKDELDVVKDELREVKEDNGRLKRRIEQLEMEKAHG